MPHCLAGQADAPVCGSSVSATRLTKGQRSLQEVARNSRIDASSNLTSAGGGNPMMQQQPPSGPEPMSDLNKLFASWGVKYDSQLVLADVASQTRIASGYSPTVLSVSENRFYFQKKGFSGLGSNRF